MPLIHALRGKQRHTEKAEEGGTVYKSRNAQGSWQPREARRERKGRILSPRAFIQRVGGPGDTLMSDFGFPEQRENKSLLSHAVWGTLGSPGKRT